MKGILISSEQIEWFIDMLCNSYGKDDVKDRILGALEMVLTEEQHEWTFLSDKNAWKPIYADDITLRVTN